MEWIPPSELYGVSVDALGNAYTVGKIYGTYQVNFGNEVTATGGSSNIYGNLVIAKFNSLGVAQWANTASPAPNVSVFHGVSADSSSNVYAVGHIGGQFGFGNEVTVTSYGSQVGVVIVKYRP